MKKLLLFLVLAVTLTSCTSKQWTAFYYQDQASAGLACEIQSFSTQEACEGWGDEKLKGHASDAYFCGYECSYDSSCQYTCEDAPNL